MKYTQIPQDTFKEIQLNAGILLADFDPQTASFENADMLGATSGGVNFSAVPSFIDYGEDIDNCPKNTMELKKLDSWEVRLSGTFVSMNTARAKSVVAAADIDGADTTKIVPRNSVLLTDFNDVWWVGDYSDKNDGNTAGFIAIHMKNALSTGGFQIQSSDKAKGQFAFEYTAHFSMDAQDEVQFDLYIKAGTGAA